MVKNQARIVQPWLGVFACTVAAVGLPRGAPAADPAVAAKPPVAAAKFQRKALRCDEFVNVWQRVAGRETRQVCAQLDRARANLIKRPQLARKLAEGVLAERPLEVQALLLVAHADWQMGRAEQAYEQFLALGTQERANGAPSTPVVHLWARARAAAQLGAYEQARVWYRQLLLALEALPDSTERACALLEAAWVSLYAGENYQEALSYLRRAQEEDVAIWREVARGAEVVVGTLTGEPSPVESAALYARLAWLFEQETQAKRRTLFLPKLGAELLLAHLAWVSDRPRAAPHLAMIACEGGLPGHLSARLVLGPPVHCSKDESLDDEWSGPDKEQ